MFGRASPHSCCHFVTSAHRYSVRTSLNRDEKKWNAAVFIIFHHQLFTTLFTGPKKHFTRRRQGGNPGCWVLFKWVDSVICAQTAFHVSGVKNLEKCSGWLFIRSHQTLVNPKTNMYLCHLKLLKLLLIAIVTGPICVGEAANKMFQVHTFWCKWGEFKSNLTNFNFL